MIEGYAHEGGIPYKVKLPEAPAVFQAWLDSLPCSCGGDLHDECGEEEE